MRRLAAAVIIAGFLVAPPASAGILIQIDKSTQRMTVNVDGASRYHWRVSTGRAGFGTPNGSFRPQRLARKWFSRKYYNSPMPYSIFFHRGYAIHGSYEIKRLGGPASHGCVRLHPTNAAVLFGLVQKYGMRDTRIVVTGQNAVPVARKRERTRSVSARADERRLRRETRRLRAERAEARSRRYVGRTYYYRDRYDEVYVERYAPVRYYYGRSHYSW